MHHPGYIIVIPCLLLTFLLHGCSNRAIYKSSCDDNIPFKKVALNNLMDSLKHYNGQYVEVSGIYHSGKEESGLYDDKLINVPVKKKALWVNFSQDCPLYKLGTNKGFFEYTDGGFVQIKNKKVRMRGKIDAHNQGYKHRYGATLDHVSLIEL